MRKWGEKFTLPLPIRKKVCMPPSDVVPPTHTQTHTHAHVTRTSPVQGVMARVVWYVKSPSCVYRWYVALICRIQAFQSEPHPHLSLPTLWVSLLVKSSPALPWPWPSAGWLSPSYSGWPCKHVVNLGTAEPQFSQVWGGNRWMEKE